ncbi:PREDICTED: pentatricopeptide repeat-containing protein At2g21090 [Fragaria vesca subsp. vesca]|uniref:pentatricopeptide repeat-containing protein At2g21090 n=1 Tax=Fragaria vesca subsp. vesca TaxID=101020 RepID=UPI0002C321A4|nr:PREDICTED: pentatricopeptide repeat-containing protein At2g21090 [Fragaria vesca subsp. vesca]XP_011466963.1 PREDICTED: pentatricopeptide repeat-containing protein At2g21090 [Fragaria vesca subsp. vesca]XP_011466972.1 PREDICTED: pentatricopeptide repeat-containing protein At2g21090 [Fragaria vesca subsp. vesca]XP_011466978.1 PREDICTED: pentatricopeptide repeat-containing protein At2g21090 [Fragaria vesca subsp. vesca]XP_011466982.1 PREDICTED: pentatricopeptide repeat-containing protein At2g2
MPSLSSPSLTLPKPNNKHLLPNKTKPSCLVQSILSLCSQGRLSQAVSSLDLLFRKGIRLPTKALALVVQHCRDTRSLRDGKWVHFYLRLTGFKRPPLLLANHLIGMYFKCGDEVNARKVFDKMLVRNLYSWNNMLSGYAKMRNLKEARSLFEKMTERDVVSWNTMVIGYAQSGDCDEALRFYRELRRSAFGLNEFSFAGVLTVCVKLKELGVVRQAHGQVLVAGFLSNVVLSSSLVDAYAKCGEMGDGRRLFDEMGVRDVLAWTTLVSGYAKWGDMRSAGELFDMMPEKNPVSWTSMISGYARNGLGHEALALFAKMMMFQVRPDQFTFSSCLCACASIASLKHGKQIHASLVRSHLRPNTIVLSSLIDMYSKCGNLGAARQVFKLLGDKQDTVLWNTMMSALAQHGHGIETLQMFEDMVGSGVKPVTTTFVVILNACSHSGLVLEGRRLFKSMTDDYGIVPNEEHYACLIDLLGRAGCFDELMNQLENMPCKAGDQVWNALLGVCRIHGNTELGRKVAEHLLELEPQSSAPYVLLSSIYAEEGRWELVEKVRRLMDERHVRKERAISWLEVGSRLHAFTVSDRLHPLKEEIYSVLKQLADQMEEDASLTNLEN